MLPPKITDLINAFIERYDAENPLPIIDSTNKVLLISSTALFWPAWLLFPKKSLECMDVILMSSAVGKFRSHIRKRTLYIWSRLQEVLETANIETNGDLAADIKAFLFSQIDTVTRLAIPCVERCRFLKKKTETDQDWRPFEDLLFELKAEIDLFVLRISSKASNSRTDNITITDFYGVFGNVSSSKISISDYTSIQRNLFGCDIPKQDRRELEDILDELKVATPPEKKQSLVARAEELIAKHREALGAAAEILVKNIKAALE